MNKKREHKLYPIQKQKQKRYKEKRRDIKPNPFKAKPKRSETCKTSQTTPPQGQEKTKSEDIPRQRDAHQFEKQKLGMPIYSENKAARAGGGGESCHTKVGEDKSMLTNLSATAFPL